LKSIKGSNLKTKLSMLLWNGKRHRDPQLMLFLSLRADLGGEQYVEEVPLRIRP